MEAATNQTLSHRRPWRNKPSHAFIWPSLKLIWKLLHRYTCCHHKPFRMATDARWRETSDPPPARTHTHRFEPLDYHHYNISVTTVSVYHAQ